MTRSGWPAAELLELRGVEAVRLERGARRGIDVVQDHREPTGAGSDSAYGAR